MVYQSEAELEKRLINDLVDYKNYKQVSCPNETDLESNFKQQLELFNREALGGASLTDKEYERVLVAIKGKSVFQSAKILRDKLVLQRDDGSEVYLKLFDMKNPLNNCFQVSSQVTMVGKYTNRYDVTILVTCIPAILYL